MDIDFASRPLVYMIFPSPKVHGKRKFIPRSLLHRTWNSIFSLGLTPIADFLPASLVQQIKTSHLAQKFPCTFGQTALFRHSCLSKRKTRSYHQGHLQPYKSFLEEPVLKIGNKFPKSSHEVSIRANNCKIKQRKVSESGGLVWKLLGCLKKAI